MSVASRFFMAVAVPRHGGPGWNELIGATARGDQPGRTYRCHGVQDWWGCWGHFLLKKRKISLKACLLRKIVITLLVDTKYNETVTGHINVDARAGNVE